MNTIVSLTNFLTSALQMRGFTLVKSITSSYVGSGSQYMTFESKQIRVFVRVSDHGVKTGGKAGKIKINDHPGGPFLCFINASVIRIDHADALIAKIDYIMEKIA